MTLPTITLPTFSTKTKVIGSIVIVVVAFASGRYSVQTAPAVHIVADTKQQTDTATNTDTDVHKKTVTDKKPDGEVITTVTDDTTIEQIKIQNKELETHTDTTITPPVRKTLNLSVLAGTDPLNSFKPLYGFSVNKEVLGPVTIGAWGLTNNTFGVSVGVNF